MGSDQEERLPEQEQIKDISISIPKVEFEGEDQQLLKRVHKFKAGTLRIILFTLVGMIMGWFSIEYYTNSFIVTKAILAIPYKISEAIYVNFIGTKPDQSFLIYERMTEFFPQSFVATFLAERITPVLIGGAIYGCLGYFTGNKKVFTMQRFVKFVALWSITILGFIAATYGVNSKAIADNSKFKNITDFYLISERTMTCVDEDKFKELKVAFFKDLTPTSTYGLKQENEHPFMVISGHSRSMICYANWVDGYIYTENGDMFYASKEFLDYVKEYYETNGYMDEKLNQEYLEMEEKNDEEAGK